MVCIRYKEQQGANRHHDQMLYKTEGDPKSRWPQIQGPWFFQKWFKPLSINYSPLSAASYRQQLYRNWAQQCAGPVNSLALQTLSLCLTWLFRQLRQDKMGRKNTIPTAKTAHAQLHVSKPKFIGLWKCCVSMWCLHPLNRMKSKNLLTGKCWRSEELYPRDQRILASKVAELEWVS